MPPAEITPYSVNNITWPSNYTTVDNYILVNGLKDRTHTTTQSTIVWLKLIRKHLTNEIDGHVIDNYHNERKGQHSVCEKPLTALT